MAPCEDLKPLDFFQNINCEKLNFLTIFFSQPLSNQGIKMSFQIVFLDGNSCIKAMILPYTYQTYISKL